MTASGGLEGLKLAKELRPIAITLDVMMPDLDGWSVLAALRQDPELAEIPVIMMTILDEHRRGVALGAAGYLTKPIDREQLHRLVYRFRAWHSRPASCWSKTMPFSGSGCAMAREPAMDCARGGERKGGAGSSPTRASRTDPARSDDARDGRLPGRCDLAEGARWRDIPVIVITALDLDAKDRERLNSGVQFVLVKETFQGPADLVERIRRLVHSKPAVSNRMEAALRDLIADQLEAEGFSVVAAAGGLEGLKLAKELRPIAITLDVMMPDLDGWSVLAALRQDPELAVIPVIMITIVDEHRRGVALGAAGYLTKPIDRERLRHVIGRFRAPGAADPRPGGGGRCRPARADAGMARRSAMDCARGKNGRVALNRIQREQAGRNPARSNDAGDGRLCGGRRLTEGGRLV